MQVKVWVVGTKVPEDMKMVEIRKMLGEKKENSTGTREEVMARLMRE
jgi:hypothetical protein